MTLVNRVSLFFLLALAVALAGYSVLGYVLIRNHLIGEFDGQLRSSFNSLVAAIEVEPDSVKWQPTEHTVAMGDEATTDEIRWILTDGAGKIVDASANLERHSSEAGLLVAARSNSNSGPSQFGVVGNWRYLRTRRVATEPLPIAEREADEFAVMDIVAARNVERLHRVLWQLAAMFCVLPLVVWCIAALAGQQYCRRALAPVSAMAKRTRAATAEDFTIRLPEADRRDELGELSRSFNHLLDQLQQAYLRQQRFTGDAAHQLRTPLTILRGQIDVALRRERSTEGYRTTLSGLQEETSRLEAIIESLLQLARSDDQVGRVEQIEVDLAGWIANYWQQWRNHPRRADMSYDVDPAARITTHSPLLAQIVDNLLDNALKYSEPGSPIRLTIVQHPTRIVLAVEDQGMGIASSEAGAIFAPFYRSPAARQTGVSGTGLGLALVQRIAQALGGTIAHVPSSVGSRFELTLPIRSAAT